MEQISYYYEIFSKYIFNFINIFSYDEQFIIISVVIEKVQGHSWIN